MNLASRKDRWEQTVKEVEKLGNTYKLERFEAIEDTRNPAHGNSLTVRAIIQMAKDQNMDAILLGEDDLELCDKSREAWETGVSELPEDWDILLGGVYYARGRIKVTEHLCKLSDFCALHFVLIRNTAYDLVLEYGKNNMGFNNIDRYMGRLAMRKKLNVYVVWPMVSSQRAGYSNLRKKDVDDNKNNKRKGLNFLTESVKN